MIGLFDADFRLRPGFHGHHTRQGFGAGAGLGCRDSRQRAHHDATGFCLPPGIHDRAGAATNFFVIPHPGFRIDPFAHAAEQSQAGQIVFLDMLIAPFDKRTNRRRRCVEES